MSIGIGIGIMSIGIMSIGIMSMSIGIMVGEGSEGS